MSFLTPWFLLGGLAIAGPVLFHLVRRTVRDRVPFSSIMFLRPAPPRLTRRSRIEHFWLLLLRCLCLLLLAIGFARPFFAKENILPPATTDGCQTILLLDVSASMRRAGVWDKARALAAQHLKKAAEADEVSLVAFDRQSRSIISFAEWSSWPLDQRSALAEQRLENLAPGWKGTQLGLALTTAAEQFVSGPGNRKTPARRELVLISDLQEGAKLDGLQGHEWPADVKVTVERAEAKHPGNAGLGVADEGNRRPDQNDVRVRVTNSRDSGQEKFQLGWNQENESGFAGSPVEVYLPSGQTRTFSAPKVPAGVKPAQLRLMGDLETFDNLLHWIAPETEHLQIAWFGSDPQNDPTRMRYYLERVFPKTSQREVRLISPTTNFIFSPGLLQPSAFAILTTNLNSDEVEAVRHWLAEGNTALLVVSDLQMAPTLAGLSGLRESHLTEADGDYTLLGQIDFTHPIFAPFADPRFSDFTHIHFWKHRRWEIPANSGVRVLAKFDDGSPALAMVPAGKGSLIVLTSGWNPGDSQLAVSSKFPPLIQTLLDWSGAATPPRFQFETGDAIPSPMSSGEPVEWLAPDGKSQSLAAGVAFAETGQPGIYRTKSGGKEQRFAVNLPLDESRTAPFAEEVLSRLGVPLQPVEPSPAQQQQIARRLERAELESRQKLWRWLIVGALVVVFFEIALGGRLARRMKLPEVVA